MEDKCKFIRPKVPRVMQPKATKVGDICGRQVGNKWDISGNPCGPRHPEWETSVGDSGRQVEDKWETSANSCGPRNPEWQTSVDKCKLMRPKEPRLGDKCGKQV